MSSGADPEAPAVLPPPPPFKWNPWEILPQAVPLCITIAEPPCRHCRHWNPQVTFATTPSGQVANGIRCCWVHEQERDFSCFTAREG